MSQMRVRFAPSPTGFLHIGGARTALFNWILARQQEGVFILRIEDTDAQRSTPEMAKEILEALQWLGLDWDEGPYYQSQRMALYQKTAQQLLEQDQAYPCFCPPDETKAQQAKAREKGNVWRDESCRERAADKACVRIAAGESHSLRFRVPHRGQIIFEDQVYGRVELDSRNLEDFTLLRSDGSPTYHLSVVTDDRDMAISHVIRGVDHLSNTHKHILVHEALGGQPPIHAHLPLILGPDKKRLSKRHGATSVLKYREQGVLPRALCNYLALLGWSPGDDEEFFPDGDLVRRFALERINKANAVFDSQKLDWMNSQYMRHSSSAELALHLEPILVRAGIWQDSWGKDSSNNLLPTITLFQSRLNRLSDFPQMAMPFLTDQIDYEKEAVQRHLSLSDPNESLRLRNSLESLASEYAQVATFDLKTVEQVLRTTAGASGFKPGAFFGAVRVALTGKAAAPGIFEVIVTLGRKRVVERLIRVLQILQ